MKKISTKFLSIVLTLSMVLSLIIPGAAFAASGDVLINAKTLMDTSGKSIGMSNYYLVCDGTTYKFVRFNYSHGSSSSDGSGNYEYRVTGNDSNSMRVEFNPNIDGTRTLERCKYVLSGEYKSNRAASESPNVESCTIKFNNDISHNIASSILAKTWYNFELIIDNTQGSPMTYSIVFTKKGETTPAVNITNTYPGTSAYWRCNIASVRNADLDSPNGDYEAYRYFKMVKIYPDNTAIESSVVSVDSGAQPDQPVFNFTLSHEIPGLEANDIILIDADSNQDRAISLTSDGSNNYTATMNRNLQWTDYTFQIDPSVYDDWIYSDGGGKVLASELQGSFECIPTGFAMTKDSSASTGSELSFDMKYSNNSDAWPDMTILMAAYNSDGTMADLTVQHQYPDTAGTKYATVAVPFTAGQSAKLFVIDGWSGKVPHFSGTYWGENAPITALTAYSGGEAGIWASKLDYTSNKIKVDAKMNSAATAQGVIYVYKNNAPMSDTNKPVYVNCITTASDGSFTLDIPFDGAIFTETAEYNVEFYSPSGVLTGASFEFVTESDKIKRQEADILNAAKGATTLGGIKQAILGINELEQSVTNSYGNNNFDIFKRTADVTEYYNSLGDKDGVFTRMLEEKSTLAGLGAYPLGYTALVEFFEAKAQAQYEYENDDDDDGYSGGGGGGGGGFGGGVAADNAVPGGTTSAIKDNSPAGSTAAGGSAFADMAGHWASEFASELKNRGIMNGYPDGSFGGEGLITRAEIAKTLVEAMDVAHGAGSGHYDIAGDEWHAPYIAGAAAAGIVTGFEDGSFGPDLNISRQDAAVMIYRALKLKVYMPTGYTFFTDDLDISAYASEAIRCLGDLKIITGSPDGRFNPLQPITRAEIAALMCRALDYVESH